MDAYVIDHKRRARAHRKRFLDLDVIVSAVLPFAFCRIDDMPCISSVIFYHRDRNHERTRT